MKHEDSRELRLILFPITIYRCVKIFDNKKAQLDSFFHNLRPIILPKCLFRAALIYFEIWNFEKFSFFTFSHLVEIILKLRNKRKFFSVKLSKLRNIWLAEK